MISSLNYASPSFMAQQAVKVAPAKDQKPVNAQKPVAKPLEKAPAKKADKKQTGKSAMIGMALVTAGSLFYGIKKGSALKKALNTVEAQAAKIVDLDGLLQNANKKLDALQARGFFKRIFTSNKKV